MIRPIFNVSQDEKFIYIEAKIKYVKISDFEYFIENNNFRFTLKPYYLNINLPGNLNSESKQNSFSYDPENQKLLCKIEKSNIGQNFENLQFISTLYENKSKGENDKALSNNKSIFSKIEEINNNNEYDLNNNSFNIQINNSKDFNDYLFKIYTEEKKKLKNSNSEAINELKDLKNPNDYKYGFNNNFFDVFDKRKEEMIEICDLNPKDISINKRYLFKLEKENNDFNPERYLTDLFLDDKNSDFYDESFNNIIEDDLNDKDKMFLESIKDKNNKDNFDEIENEVLYKISKLNLNSNTINDDSRKNIFKYKFSFYLNIIDILFAYLYNCLITEYENSSESGWTINKLSASLSCLIDFDLNYYSQSNEISFDILEESIENLIISNYRRVLIYPLYRNIKICNKVKNILIKVLNLGRFSILKCLLKIKNIFDKNEPRFLLNIIYIDPLIKWIQNYGNDKIFEIIKEELSKIIINKDKLKLDLEIFEKDYLSQNNEMEED